MTTEPLEIRLTRIEEQLKQHSRHADSVQELTRAMDRMTRTVEDMAEEIAEVTKSQRHLYRTHDALLKDRAEQERKALEKQLADAKPSAIAKKYLPTATLLSAIVALFRILGTAFELWVRYVQQH
jgi:uncharacterized protein YoxC